MLEALYLLPASLSHIILYNDLSVCLFSQFLLYDVLNLPLIHHPVHVSKVQHQLLKAVSLNHCVLVLHYHILDVKVSLVPDI